MPADQNKNRASRQLIFLTRSVDLKCLTDGHITTSSQAYEVGLVNEIRKTITTSIINIGTGKDKKNNGEVKVSESLYYTPKGRLLPINLFILLKQIAELKCKNKEIYVVTTGYYPLEMVLLLFARIIGSKVYSIVFDSHLASTIKMPFPKRYILNIYFSIGYFLVRRLNGIAIVNEGFIIRDRLRKMRIHKTKIGYSRNNRPCGLAAHKSKSEPNDKIKIIFAGTLNNENGVEIVLNALRMTSNKRIRIEFFGDGDSSEAIAAEALNDSRIAIRGRVTDTELDHHIANSQYLINLRDPTSVASLYSFPSKLIKFMGSGVPVISNSFPGIDPCLENKMIIIPSFSARALADQLELLGKQECHVKIAHEAKIHIEKKYSWPTIAKDLVDFICA